MELAPGAGLRPSASEWAQGHRGVGGARQWNAEGADGSLPAAADKRAAVSAPSRWGNAGIWQI